MNSAEGTDAVCPWIRRLNGLLAEDVMHGIQWCDLDGQEQGWFREMRDNGLTPEEALDTLMEGPV